MGVTCLLPGAVKDTAFAKRSDIEEAACFHFPGTRLQWIINCFCVLVDYSCRLCELYTVGTSLPGYAKTPECVAGEGVKVRKILIIIHPSAQMLMFSSHFIILSTSSYFTTQGSHAGVSRGENDVACRSALLSHLVQLHQKLILIYRLIYILRRYIPE